MLGELNEEQIENLLNDLPIGRIGCHADGITYIVPVNYVYDGIAIYVHSAKGLKIDMMRKNPEVCFQTDAIESLHGNAIGKITQKPSDENLEAFL